MKCVPHDQKTKTLLRTISGITDVRMSFTFVATPIQITISLYMYGYYPDPITYKQESLCRSARTIIIQYGQFGPYTYLGIILLMYCTEDIMATATIFRSHRSSDFRCQRQRRRRQYRRPVRFFMGEPNSSNNATEGVTTEAADDVRPHDCRKLLNNVKVFRGPTGR
jgi:hypothetical protein